MHADAFKDMPNLLADEKRIDIDNADPLGHKTKMSHDHPHDHSHGPGHSHSHEHSTPHTHERPPLRKRMHLPAYKMADAYPEGLQKVMARAKQELADEFRGITTDGIILPGLFPVKKTGVTLQPMVEAARAFLATLSHQQQHDIQFEIGSEAWRSWCNVHPFLMRHGVGLHTLNAPQREAALALVSKALSASGFETARNVMRLNEHAAELSSLPEEYNEWYYWMSVFGTPSLTEPWGWQFDGHHLIINCLVVGDQIVLTPNFMGSEPVFAQSGKFAGTHVFQAEESAGLALMQGLTREQQARAIVGTTLPGDVLGTAFRDNLQFPREGIRYDELESTQQEALRNLLGVYVNRIRPGHANIRFDEVCDHLRETQFAWIGDHDDKSAFYYRLYSPVVLIEFDHQPGVVYANNEPSRDHIHTLVRTPNGNDYGKDLLRQHYEQHDHANPASPHRSGKR